MKLDSLLGHAAEIYAHIEKSALPPDRELEYFFRNRKYLGARDRKIIAETVYHTLRHLKRIEYILSRQNQTGRSSDSGTLNAHVLVATGWYLLKKDQNDESLTSYYDFLHTHQFFKFLSKLDVNIAPQELGSSDPYTKEYLSVKHSFPVWMIDEITGLTRKQNPDVELAVLNQQAPTTLRTNTLKTTRERLLEILSGEGIAAAPTVHSPFGITLSKRLNVFNMPSFKEGYFEMQDEGSQIIGWMLDPKPNIKVFDACAGAGGKSLLLSMIMQNRGEIVASDIHSERLARLKMRARKAGAGNIRILEHDALQPYEDTIHGKYDLALVDAPCSGLGTIRRNPGMKWTVTTKSTKELSIKQSTILRHCAQLVRPGGLLVYITCTFVAEENEKVATDFLEKTNQFESITPDVHLKKKELTGMSDGRFLRLNPWEHGTDLFFGALFRRRIEESHG